MRRLRNWTIAIAIERDSEVPYHLQIVNLVAERIRTGLLRPGTPLPGTRVLAGRLGVNRKTVVQAYDELCAQGWAQPQARRGTFVSSALAPGVGAARGQLHLVGAMAPPAYRLHDAAMPLPSEHASGVTDLGDGAPDTRLLPFAMLSRAFRHGLLAAAREGQLGYADPRGLPALRAALALQLRTERGLQATPESICLVRGSQMGIFLAARVLVRPGDAVVFETLTYPPARAAFRSCGATVLSVAQDGQGMRLDALEALCRTRSIRAIYLTPQHQFPTTVTMPVARRLRLLSLAKQYDFVIVEDDYDHEFHFASSPLLPLASMDHHGRVIYIGSYSKILAPTLRLGYVVAPAPVIDRFAAEAALVDRQGNAVTEHAVADMMASGELARHMRRSVRIYEQRWHSAFAAVRQALAGVGECLRPDGGLALWVTFAKGTDMVQLAHEARRRKLAFMAASACAEGASDLAALRLGFGALTPGEFGAALHGLGHAVAALPMVCHAG